MKVIFSRIYIEKANDGNVIQDRSSLLGWFLSVLKWNQLGYETILYTDEIIKTEFDELGLTQLYSEVKMIDSFNVDKEVFWACSKVLSAKQFMTEYPDEEFIISDLDYIPLADPKTFVKTDNDLVTFYGEYRQMYPDLKYLELNPDYNIPDFYTGVVDPINTCLLYIRESLLDLFSKYLDIELDFMSYHKTFINGQKSNDLMTFVEQRLFTEYLTTNGIDITFVSPKNKSVFNTNGIHTGPYKSIEKAEYWKWIIWWLKLIREESTSIYNHIIKLDLYSDVREIIESGKGKYKNKKNKEIEIINFDWNTLEYPKAFEDIYDPVWRD